MAQSAALRSLRPTLRTIHRWSGLLAAPLFLAQAVSGILWSNQEALTPIFHAEARRAQPGSAPLDDVLHAIAVRAPDARLDRVSFPHNPQLPLTARVVSANHAIGILLIDRATGRVLSSGPLASYPEQIAERVHGSLMVSQVGHWIVFGEGVVLLAMATSGLVLWWPGLLRLRSALVVHVDGPPRRLIRELHLVPGVFSAALLLVIGATGALMAAEPLTTGLIGLIAPVAPDIAPQAPQDPAPRGAKTAEQALAILQSRFPSGRLVKVRTLGPESRMILGIVAEARPAHPTAYDMAGLDRATGVLTVYADASRGLPGDDLVGWLAPIHAGEIYGRFRPLITTSGALAIILMTSTGLSNWLVRRPPRPRKPS